MCTRNYKPMYIAQKQICRPGVNLTPRTHARRHSRKLGEEAFRGAVTYPNDSE